jgi:aldehyde dehydrogenase (NAD+)
VLGYIELGQQEGARVMSGGYRAGDELSRGFFVAPTVLGNVSNDMRVAREEIFGPVVAIMRFEDVEEAVRLANATSFGLCAGVWTRDIAKAHRVAAALRCGTVWVNTYGMFDPSTPYGGYKMSGYGRELGEAALDAYTQVKSVWINTGS